MKNLFQTWDSHLRGKEMRRDVEHRLDREREYPTNVTQSPTSPPLPSRSPPQQDEESQQGSEGEESDESDGSGEETGPSTAHPFYDRSPGEVYTIPEEEEEAASPTGGDGVTSLRQRRLAGGGCFSVQPACWGKATLESWKLLPFM